MGYETKCRVRVTEPGGTREADATVLLETDELVVRGEARIRIKRDDIRQITRRDGTITVASPTATLTLILGEPAAARWEKKIAEPPKQLIDKLDVKPGASVVLIGSHDASLVAQLAQRTTNVSRSPNAKQRDVAFVAVGSKRDLDRIKRASTAIADDGSIWVVHPKGPNGVADTAIFSKAKELGLTYTKVARVSDQLTAEKLVRPVAKRAAAKRTTARTAK